MVLNPVQTVTYVSQSRIPEADHARVMRELSQSTQARNAKLGITGVLFLRGSVFIQYLEGPANVIGDLMDDIKSDPRHESVYVVLNEKLDERRFDVWSAATFHNPDCADDFLETLYKLGQACLASGGFTPSTVMMYIWRMVADMAAHRIDDDETLNTLSARYETFRKSYPVPSFAGNVRLPFHRVGHLGFPAAGGAPATIRPALRRTAALAGAPPPR